MSTEIRKVNPCQMVRLLGFFDVHIRPKKYSYKKSAPPTDDGRRGIFMDRISRRSS